MLAFCWDVVSTSSLGGMGWNEESEWEWGVCAMKNGWHKKRDDIEMGTGGNSGVESVPEPCCCVFWNDAEWEWTHDAELKKTIHANLWKTTLDVDMWEWMM